MPHADSPLSSPLASSPLASSPLARERRSGTYRVAALACIYGAAVAFAVLCSPAVGLIDLGHPPSLSGHAIALQIWPDHLNR